MSEKPPPLRIVLTGGPGGGKSTAGDLLRREMGPQVAFVPEAATLLFMGGFPRYSENEALKAAQKSIFHVQKGLEDSQLCHFPGRVLLCDRGTLDGAAYWPEGADSYFQAMGTTLEEELGRYSAVMFFETAAVSKLAINASMLEGGNAARTESANEAVEVDCRLRKLWEKHPNFYLIKNEESFFKKIKEGVRVFYEILDKSTPQGLSDEEKVRRDSL